MTLRKATLYVGGGSLLVAWFSSAASVSLTRSPRRVPASQEAVASPIDGVAGNVQAQARRLKQRLAAAPLPQRPVRNPFAFRPAPLVPSTPAMMPVRRVAAEPAAALPPVEPRLELVGIAEQHVDQVLVRTAMIATESNDLIMAVVGGSVLGRYKVAAIAADGVELTDTTTGQARRLVLQPQ
jgi:hypothetical protein